MSIAADGLGSDASMRHRNGPVVSIGMRKVKDDRLRAGVSCHPGDFVGDYVPFNFCPRSVMLYVIYKGNHPELTYRGGQRHIVHLELDLNEVIAWTDESGQHWAFTDVNARAQWAQFFADLSQLDQINWAAVRSNEFSLGSGFKEPKQAEFLVRGPVPWELVSRVVVASNAAREEALQALASASHQPPVDIIPGWYF
jgi:hypothetical protein